MAISQAIEMSLKIGAIFTGASALKQASGGISDLMKKTGLANINFMKLAGAAAGVALGFKGIQTIGNFMGGARTQAKAAQKSMEDLNVALSRQPRFAKMGTEWIAKQEKALEGLAGRMEQTGAVSAPALTAGFSKLIAAGFSPAQINQMSAGFEGVVVAMKGVNAQAADVAEVGVMMGDAIRRGRVAPELGRILGMTDKQLVAFRKLGSGSARAAELMKLVERQSGRTAFALGTSEGKAASAALAWERLQRIMGTPFLKTEDAFNVAMSKMANALEPVANKLAGVLAPAMERFAKWIEDQSPNIEKFGDVLVDAFDWVLKNGDKIGVVLGVIGAGLGGLAVVSILTNPLTLLVGALAAVGAGIVLLIDNWDKIAPALTNAKNAILGATEGIWKPIADSVQKAWPDIAVQLDWMWANLQAAMSGELKWGEALENIGESLKIVGTKIQEAFAQIDWGSIANTLGTKFGEIWRVVAQTATQLGTQILNVLTSIDWGSVAQGMGRALGESVRIAIGAAVIVFYELPKMALESLAGTSWDDWASVLTTAMSNALTAGGWLLQMAGNFIKGFVEGVTGADWGSVVSAFQAGMQKVWTAILDGAKNLGPQILNMITGGLGNLGGAVLGKLGLGGKQQQAAETAAPAPVAQQLGGLITSPTLAMLGERGSEMVVPLTGSGGGRGPGLLSQAAGALGLGGMRGGMQGGPMSVNVSPVINISGVAAGQEAAVGREVERALRDPIRSMLDQLKQARDEERRLAYV